MPPHAAVRSLFTGHALRSDQLPCHPTLLSVLCSRGTLSDLISSHATPRCCAFSVHGARSQIRSGPVRPPAAVRSLFKGHGLRSDQVPCHPTLLCVICSRDTVSDRFSSQATLTCV